MARPVGVPHTRSPAAVPGFQPGPDLLPSNFYAALSDSAVASFSDTVAPTIGRVVITDQAVAGAAAALTFTNKDSGATDTPGTSYATNSVAFQNSKLYLLTVYNRASTATITSVSGGGINWVQVATIASGNGVIYVYRGLVTSGASTGAVTINCNSATAAKWSIEEVANADQSGTDGSGAIVQSNTAQGTGTTATATLSAFADAVKNAAFEAVGHGNATESTTPDASGGWAALTNEQTVVSPTSSLLTAYKIGQDLSVTATWTTSVQWAEVAVEVDAAVGVSDSVVATLVQGRNITDTATSGADTILRTSAPVVTDTAMSASDTVATTRQRTLTDTAVTASDSLARSIIRPVTDTAVAQSDTVVSTWTRTRGVTDAAIGDQVILGGKRNSFEGGTNGTSISAANSGGASGDAFTSVSSPAPTFTTARAAHGSLSMDVTEGGTSQAIWVQQTLAVAITGEVYGRVYVYPVSPFPSGESVSFVQVHDSAGTEVIRLRLMMSTLTLRLVSSGATVGTIGTVALTADAWNRVDFRFKPGVSANGEGEWYLFKPANIRSVVGGTSDEHVNSTGLTLTGDGTTVGDARVGAAAASSQLINVSFGWDDLVFGAASWPGPAYSTTDDVGIVFTPAGTSTTRNVTDTAVSQSDAVATTRVRVIADTAVAASDAVATIRQRGVTDTAVSQTDTVSRGIPRGVSDYAVGAAGPRDEFNRSITAGTSTSWGTADTGETWTILGSTAGLTYGVDGSRATNSVTAGNASRRGQTVPISGANQEVLVAASLDAAPTGGAFITSIYLRATDINNFYGAEMSISSTGVVQYRLRKLVANASTVLVSAASAGLPTYVGGAVVWMRGRIEGSTLSVKLWMDGTPEPVAWTTQTTDTSIATGANVGVGGQGASGVTNAITQSFDHFAAETIMSDSVVATSGTRNITDTATSGADTVATTRARVIADTAVAQSDNLTTTRIRGVADQAVTASDVVATTRRRAVTDQAVSFSDSVARSLVATRAIIDQAVTQSDTAGRLTQRIVADTAVTQTDTVATTRSRIITDTVVSASDTVATLRRRAVTDQATTQTDSVAIGGRLRAVTDQAATQTDQVATTRQRGVTDTAESQTDTLTTTRQRGVTDTALTASDTVATTRRRAITDTAVSQSDAVAAGGRLRTATDQAATQTDTLQRVIRRGVIDTATAVIDTVGRVFLRQPTSANWTPTAGAWLLANVNLTASDADWATREASLGRSFDGRMKYKAITTSSLTELAVDTFAAVAYPTVGSLPFSGNNTIPSINAGSQDANLIAFANACKNIAPTRVFVRLFWEFNLGAHRFNPANYVDASGVAAPGTWADFISAWQRVWTVFFGTQADYTAAGITGTAVGCSHNQVKFAYNPNKKGGASVTDPTLGYPGSQYVDWIFIDTYPSRASGGNEVLDSPTTLLTKPNVTGALDWYNTFAPYGKPLGVGETSVHPVDDSTTIYGSGISPLTRTNWWSLWVATLKAFPLIRLVTIFDANDAGYPTSNHTWKTDAASSTTGDSGATAFAAYSTFANDAYMLPSGLSSDDALFLYDSVATTIGHGNYIVTDTATSFSDTVARTAVHPRAVSDTAVSQSDTVTARVTQRAISDVALFFSDFVSRIHTYVRQVTDQAVIPSDQLSTTRLHGVADTAVAQSDSVATIRRRQVSDQAVSQTDTLATLRRHGITDTALTESDTVQTTRQRRITDQAVSQTDTVQTPRLRQVTDQAITQTDQVQTTRRRGVSDTAVTQTDAVATPRLRLLTDQAVSQTDAVTTRRQRGVSDTALAQTDSLIVELGRLKLVTDQALTQTDAISPAAARRVTDQALVQTDTVSVNELRLIHVSDQATTISDALRRSLVVHVADQGVSLSDSVTRVHAAARAVSDQATSISDSLRLAFRRLVVDQAVSFSDEPSTETAGHVTVQDHVVSASDTVGRLAVLARFVSDTAATVADIVATLRRRFFQLTDQAETHTDLIEPHRVITRRITDQAVILTDEIRIRRLVITGPIETHATESVLQASPSDTSIHSHAAAETLTSNPTGVPFTSHPEE